MFFVCLSRFVRGLDKIAKPPLKRYLSQTQLTKKTLNLKLISKSLKNLHKGSWDVIEGIKGNMQKVFFIFYYYGQQFSFSLFFMNFMQHFERL